MSDMEFKTMPKEAIAELLFFLAEHEDFSSIRQLNGGVTVQEVRAAFREVAQRLRQEADTEWASHSYNPQKDRRLSKEAKEIISYLSPGEERTLLSAFGLVDIQKRSIE